MSGLMKIKSIIRLKNPIYLASGERGTRGTGGTQGLRHAREVTARPRQLKGHTGCKHPGRQATLPPRPLALRPRTSPGTRSPRAAAAGTAAGAPLRAHRNAAALSPRARRNRGARCSGGLAGIGGRCPVSSRVAAGRRARRAPPQEGREPPQ